LRAGLTIRCFKRLTHSRKYRASKWKATENKSRKKYTKNIMVRFRHHSHNFPFVLNFFLISLYFSKTSFSNSLSPHNILPSSIISRINVDPSFNFFKKNLGVHRYRHYLGEFHGISHCETFPGIARKNVGNDQNIDVALVSVIASGIGPKQHYQLWIELRVFLAK